MVLNAEREHPAPPEAPAALRSILIELAAASPINIFVGREKTRRRARLARCGDGARVASEMGDRDLLEFFKFSCQVGVAVLLVDL